MSKDSKTGSHIVFYDLKEGLIYGVIENGERSIFGGALNEHETFDECILREATQESCLCTTEVDELTASASDIFFVYKNKDHWTIHKKNLEFAPGLLKDDVTISKIWAIPMDKLARALPLSKILALELVLLTVFELKEHHINLLIAIREYLFSHGQKFKGDFGPSSSNFLTDDPDHRIRTDNYQGVERK